MGLFCPECGKVLPDPPYFCNWCGCCINKICQECGLFGFSKHCTMCGEKMVPFTQIGKIEVKLEPEPLSAEFKTQLKPENDTKPSISKEITNKPAKTPDYCHFTEIKVKAHILKGDDMKEVKLENGGGRRSIIMKKKSSYNEVLTKLKDKYFPRNKFTSLGSLKNYIITPLDFKKDSLKSSGYFTTLENYLESNGLRANQGPAFYLHLTDKPIYVNNNDNPRASSSHDSFSNNTFVSKSVSNSEQSLKRSVSEPLDNQSEAKKSKTLTKLPQKTKSNSITSISSSDSSDSSDSESTEKVQSNKQQSTKKATSDASNEATMKLTDNDSSFKGRTPNKKALLPNPPASTSDNFDSLSLTPSSPVTEIFHDDNEDYNDKSYYKPYNDTSKNYEAYNDSNYYGRNYRGSNHQNNFRTNYNNNQYKDSNYKRNYYNNKYPHYNSYNNRQYDSK